MEQPSYDLLPDEVAIPILNYCLQPDVRISNVAEMLSVSKRIRSLILLAVDSASLTFYPSEEHFRKQITFWRNCPRLKSLEVYGPRRYLESTEESIGLISQLTTIEAIKFVHGLKVSEDTWHQLLHHSQIRSLWLTAIQDELVPIMRKILPQLSQLTSLTIVQSPTLGIAVITSLTNLKYLNYRNLGTLTSEEWNESETGTYLWHKIGRLTKLEDLELNNIDWDDDLTDVLLTMTNLTRLTVGNCNEEEFFQQLSKLTSLRHLILTECDTLSKSRVDVLASLPTLTYMVLHAYQPDLSSIDDSPEHLKLKQKLFVL